MALFGNENDMTNNYEGDFMNANAVDNDWHGRDGYNDLFIGGHIDFLNLGHGQEDYQILRDWDRQAGVMKIVPKTHKQKISASWQSYIKDGLPYPQIQRIPISNLKVTPHQISFDFFDTTEGKIGVSNATEKHFIMEFDVYVVDLVYFMWNHAGSKNQGQLFGFDGTGGMGAYSGMRFLRQREEALKQWQEYIASDGKIKGQYVDGTYNSDGEGLMSWLGSQVDVFNWGHWNVNDWEETITFLNFRNTFLQTYTGWICTFVSQSFGVVEGVFTEVSYENEDGFSDAKWHCKVEEALFTNEYSTEGKKPTTSDGDSNNSG